jgi:formylglycine-generating enzyme required for sulfatase activity
MSSSYISLNDLRRRWEEARQRGLSLSADQLCQDCPDLLEQVRKQLPQWSSEPSLGADDWDLPLDMSSTSAGEGTWSVPLDAGEAEIPPSVSLQPGLELVPGYRLVRPLGKGAFGEVWQAEGPGEISLALKILPLHAGKTAPELRALQLMRNVHHAHLLVLSGCWQISNLLVIALELAEGTLLDRLHACQQQGLSGIPREELLAYMHEAAKALDFLNEPRHTLDGKTGVSIQHRDVKPANLLLVGGSVKVGDFGLAKLLDRALATNSGSLTVSYAPPECFRNQMTQFSDQYALAVTYCHLRGGRLPFVGPVAVVMAGHLQDPPDLSMLPPAERPVVARALAKKPEERWPNCRTFAKALEETGSIFRNATQLDLSAQERPAPPKKARGKALLAAGALVVAGFIILASWAWMSNFGFTQKTDDPTITLVPTKDDAAIGLVPKKDNPAQEVKAETSPKEELPVKKSDNTPNVKLPPREEEKRISPPGELINKSASMKLVYIAPGKFLMGSPEEEKERREDEGPQHEVEITRGFYLGKYEVTQGEYQAIMGKNLSWFSAAGDGNDKIAGKDTSQFPVEQVSWDEAKEYCRKLTERERIAGKLRQDEEYRLPTEAEWEYACRGGAKTHQAFHFGDALTSRQANFNGDSPFGGGGKGPYLERTTQVGVYGENSFGLHDMHGNVMEWCEDRYGPYQPGARRDPKGPLSGSSRVVRGGGWRNGAASCRSAIRESVPPADRDIDLGFRVARSAVAGAAP